MGVESRCRGTQGTRDLRKLEVGARGTVAPVCTADTAARVRVSVYKEVAG